MIQMSIISALQNVPPLKSGGNDHFQSVKQVESLVKVLACPLELEGECVDILQDPD